MQTSPAERMRKLYYSDNLPVLREMESNSVDLIYLDPPFNSNKIYNIIYPGDLGQVTAFEDTWYWTPQCDQHLGELRRTKVGGVLQSFVDALGKCQMCAYLINMAVRLVEMRRILKPKGSLYLHCDSTASHYLKVVLDETFGKNHFRNEIIWHYTGGGRSKTYFSRKHDTIFWYGKGKNAVFNIDSVRVPYKETSGYARGGIVSASGKRYHPHPRGTPVDDVWDIPIINPMSRERLGYPTQKPVILLERIISASSHEGDLILDPFCGCGTTAAAAEKLKRGWIGIDITYSAIAAIQERFKRQNLNIWGEIEIINQPKTVRDIETRMLDKTSAFFARKEFEKFCVATVGGLPNDKVGADGGIDGKIPLTTGEAAICSVKSGKVDVRQVRELKGLLDGRNVAGVFITKERPTQAMVDFANQSGLHTPPKKGLLAGKAFPKIQILTLEQILQGIRPDLPGM